MIQTNDSSIYNSARKLLRNILESSIAYKPTSGDEISEELELWIDSLSVDTLATFCKLLDTTQKITVQHAVIISNAWQEYHPSKQMGEASFSPILTTCIASIASDPSQFSPSFLDIVCRVTTTTLMQKLNPMLLWMRLLLVKVIRDLHSKIYDLYFSMPHR